MQKIFPYLFLIFGIFNLYRLAETFIHEVQGPFRVLAWETDINGYRIKCAVFAVIFIFAFWTNYQKNRKQ